MIRYIFLNFNFSVLFFITASAQDYDSWLTGSGTDVVTNHEKGLVLAGGGNDNDDAMTWMLERADGGDVVIIRTSNSDGYNNYFFSQLGLTLNSVETIRINNALGANDSYVLERVAGAEVLFIAGGNQTEYHDYWQGSLLQDTINYLINTKQITVGGTSAGMVVLGKYYYVPQTLGILSSEALSDPFHPYMSDIGKNDFIDHPLLTNTIHDTHFNNPDRSGRLITFMSRMLMDDQINPKAIAANEVTAICVNENNIAHVFGDHPAYDDYVYFIQTNCPLPLSMPENCQPSEPLTWDLDNHALKVYRVPATSNGNNTFDLNTWTSGVGGEWRKWYVINGVLEKEAGDSNFCPLLNIEKFDDQIISIYPNPSSHTLNINSNNDVIYEIQDVAGKLVLSGTEHLVDVSLLKNGIYFIHVVENLNNFTFKLIKE